MKENILRDKSYLFALSVIKLIREAEFAKVKQISSIKCQSL